MQHEIVLNGLSDHNIKSLKTGLKIRRTPGIQFSPNLLRRHQYFPLIAYFRYLKGKIGKIVNTVLQHLRRILDPNPPGPLLGKAAFQRLQLTVIVFNPHPLPQKFFQEISEYFLFRRLLPKVREYGGNIGAEYVVV